MRLFTGIALAPQTADRLSAVIEELRPVARINWSPVANLHITSKFIGDWPEDRLPPMIAALAAIPVTGPIHVTISGFGFFPNPVHPHSFFAAVHAGSALSKLAGAIDEALAPLGCAREARPYRPHVTIARIKPASDIQNLCKRIPAMHDFDFGGFNAAQFHLYLSKPQPGGSVYTKLATYDLMREMNANS